MSRLYIKHYVNAMDMELLYQQCIYCGHIIVDNRGLTAPGGRIGNGAPAGEIFVSRGTTTIMIAGEYFDHDKEQSKDCRDGQEGL